MKKGCGNSMRPCKKCKIFLAMPGKDYCSSCYSPKLDITPCPTGIDIPQKSQNITTSNHLVEQYQSEGGNSIQQQSIETVNVSPREGPPPEKEINEKVNKLTILLENQVKYHEELNRNFKSLKTDQDYFSNLIKEHDSRGDYENSVMFQQHYQELQEKIDSIKLEMLNSLEEITGNALKLFENQEIEEKFLNKCVQLHDGKVKNYLHNYQQGEIDRKDLLSQILKKIGIESLNLLFHSEKA